MRLAAAIGRRELLLLEIDAARDLHVHDDASDARGNDERGILNVSGLFTEDRAEQLFFRSEFGFGLRRDFADEDVAGLHLGTDANDAVVIEILQRFFTDVRDIARDFFRPELGVASGDFEFLNVDRSEDVFLQHLFGDEDRVFEVVTVPRHERDEHVAAERHLALIGRRTVGDDLARLDLLALLDDGLLIEAGAGIRAHELAEFVNVYVVLRIGLRVRSKLRGSSPSLVTMIRFASTEATMPASSAMTTIFESRATRSSMPVPTNGASAWSSGTPWRCMFEPMSARLASSCSRNGIMPAAIEMTCFGETSMQVDFFGGDFEEVAVVTDGDLADEVTLVVDLGVGLGDDLAFFLVGGEVLDLVGDAAVFTTGGKAFR